MEEKVTTITGQLLDIKSRHLNNDNEMWIVGTMKTNHGAVQISGVTPRYVHPQGRYQVIGSLISNQYGTSLDVISIHPHAERLDQKDVLIELLKRNIKNVGDATALKLVAKYGVEDFFTNARSATNEELSELGQFKFVTFQSFLNLYDPDLSGALVFLNAAANAGLVSKRRGDDTGFTYKEWESIYNMYRENDNPWGTVLKNPYNLVYMHSYSKNGSARVFNVADKIAMQEDGPTDRIERLEAYLYLYVMDKLKTSNGTYTVITGGTLEAIVSQLNLNSEQIADGWGQNDLKDKVLTYDTVSKMKWLRVLGDGDEHSFRVTASTQYSIAKQLANQINQRSDEHSKPIVDTESFEQAIKDVLDDGVQYSKEQIQAMRNANERSFSVLTGGPGTGKTSVISGLLKVFSYATGRSNWANLTTGTYHYVEQHHVKLLAPTGKAAQRLATSASYRNSNRQISMNATTIHAGLGIGLDDSYSSDGILVGSYLAPDLLIVDEVSMLDERLAATLLNSTSKDTHVMFIGDDGQLPSIGLGQVLRDLLSLDLPTTKLTKVFRNDNYIATNAKVVHENLPLTKLKLNADSGNTVMVNGRANDLREQIANIISAAYRNVNKANWKSELLVLSPWRSDKRVESTIGLNKAIQMKTPEYKQLALALHEVNYDRVVTKIETKRGKQTIPVRLNPVTYHDYVARNKEGLLFEGTYVINTKNRHPKPDDSLYVAGTEWTKYDDLEYRSKTDYEELANGEIGFVQAILGDGTVLVNFGSQMGATVNNGEDYERLIAYNSRELDNLSMAYVITVHKAQGSEAKKVIMILGDDTDFHRMMSRELIYTGITRAKDQLYIYGTVEQLADAMNHSIAKRNTFWPELV